MRMAKICFIAFGVVSLGACGSSSDETDAGPLTTPDSAVDAAPTLYYLTNGPHAAITVTPGVDGCDIGVTALIGVNFPLTVDYTSGMVTYGNTQGTPPVPSFGSGIVSANVGTLTMTTAIAAGAPSACTFNRTVTSQMTVTGNDYFTLSVTRTDSNRAAACDTEAGTAIGATCTSTWTQTVGPGTTVDGGAP